MNFSKKDVMNYVIKIFGKDPEGLFISRDILDGDLSPEECEIFTSLSNQIEYYYSSDCEIHMGMTKFVIVPKNRNYVIKVPFTGLYNYNEENDSYELYSTANLRETSIMIEKEMYDTASSLIKPLLLENRYLGMHGGIPIFVQEKAQTHYSVYDYREIDNGKDKEQLSPKEQITLFLKKKLYSHFYTPFIYSLLVNFGVKTTKLLLSELEDFDDLHSENYGYTLSGKPIILDYGGYDSSFWEG